MRVAHIIKVTRISGAERHLLVLLTALRESAIDAHLIMLVEPDKPMDEMMSEAEQRGIPTRRLIIRRDYDLALLNAIRRALREIRPDIVHTHLIHADLFGWIAAKLAGVKTVISSRHNDDQFRTHPTWRRISRLMWRLTDGGIAISGAIKDFVCQVEGAPPEKISVVYYGLEPQWTTNADQRIARDKLIAELQLEADSLILGMVCRLVQQKAYPMRSRPFTRSATAFRPRIW